MLRLLQGDVGSGKTLVALLAVAAAWLVALPATMRSAVTLTATALIMGGTIWLRGEKIRIVGYDSPEVQGACARERQLAAQATRRLRELLSSSPFTVLRPSLWTCSAAHHGPW